MPSTHLPLPEIAGQLFVSPDTVKRQAASSCHKLGASSRSEAVTWSGELGLAEGEGFIRYA